MERPTCKTCAYWGEDQGPGKERDGWCHRRPPVFPPTEALADLEGPNEPLFPFTSRDDWCGEHTDFPAYLAYLASLRAPQSSDDPITLFEALSKPDMPFLGGRAEYSLHDGGKEFLKWPLAKIDSSLLVQRVRNFGPASRVAFDEWREKVLRRREHDIPAAASHGIPEILQ